MSRLLLVVMSRVALFVVHIRYIHFSNICAQYNNWRYEKSKKELQPKHCTALCKT